MCGFFFFKQKTAYEMRISDWSSDVCSSDLDRRLLGLNNIELITDRPLQVNLDEIKAVKRDWPDRALVVSLMVPCEQACWADIMAQVEDTGADGVELNFGCPHGMSERGMGSAVRSEEHTSELQSLMRISYAV